jgi:hypothetical protein
VSALLVFTHMLAFCGGAIFMALFCADRMPAEPREDAERARWP